ncbi:MAG TPA: response regulator [Propionibacteriaceae bacterium]|nr:response regulator [Propionibacteriaceae bacterium]
MRSRRVLVVDDDDAIREVAQMALEIVGGWEVDSAATGAEAVRRAAADHPDAVLLDVMMPGMDGPTTFAELGASAQTADIPVIFLTAKVQTGDRRAWDHLDIAGVIAKPFDPLTLSSEVATLLGWT